MSTTHKGSGSRIYWTNSSGVAVTSGQVVVLAGALVTIALTDIAINASGTLIVGCGERHTLAAVTAEAWPIGARLWWNTASSKLTGDALSGMPFVGFAYAAKAAAATTAEVILAQGEGSEHGASALDWQDSVADSLNFTAAEPATPAVGDRYMNTGTGASSATAQAVVANQLLVWNGTDWTIITPSKGMAVMTEDDLIIYVFTTSWVALGTPANIKDLTDGGNADTLHVHTHASGMTDSVGVAAGGTGVATMTDHGVVLGSGTGAVTVAAVGTNGQILTGATGADPAFVTLSGAVLSVSAAGAVVLNTVDVAYGGTGGTSLTDHGVLLGSGTGAVTPAAVGTNGQILTGATGADPAFVTLSGAVLSVSAAGAVVLNTVDVAYGGTGATSLTDHGVLLGSGTGAVTPAAVGTNGQILTGATGADPAFQSVSGDGTLSASGVLAITSFAAMPTIPVAAKTATGATQANALAAPTAILAEGFNVVANADDTTGVALPPARAGAIVIVKSTVAGKNLQIWPNTDDAINAIGANGVYAQAADAGMTMLVCCDSTTWYTLPLVSS